MLLFIVIVYYQRRENMTVISNYVDGTKTFGEAEEIVEHYAELNNDPTGCYQIILKMLYIKF